VLMSPSCLFPPRRSPFSHQHHTDTAFLDLHITIALLLTFYSHGHTRLHQYISTPTTCSPNFALFSPPSSLLASPIAVIVSTPSSACEH
jgi:hypothetical protein